MRPGSVSSEAAKQAERLRTVWNNYFKKGLYGAAIDAYTEHSDWLKVEEDCRIAIQLDHSSVKARYILGLALLLKQYLDEGINELQKGYEPVTFEMLNAALDLGKGANPKGYMVDEIWQELAKAKYLQWEHASSKRSWELQSLKEACETALNEKHFLDGCKPEGFSDEAIISHMKLLEVPSQLFREASEADIPGEVPDYLCCKIIFDILRDPDITPSGVTYERAVILEYLQKVGKFDPITCEPLDQSSPCIFR